METLGRVFLVLVILGLTTSGLYYGYQKRVWEYVFPDFSLRKVAEVIGIKPSEESEIRKNVEEIKGRVEKGALESRERLEEAAKKAKVNSFSAAKDKIMSAVSGAIEAVGEKLGVGEVALKNAAEETLSGRPLIYSSVKAGELARFAVVNIFDGESEYKIDWGDNLKENGKLLKGELKTIFHRFDKEGDYLIYLKVANNQRTTSQRLPVYVFK